MNARFAMAHALNTRARRPVRALPHASYAICTTPRSGSWLLSETLASTKLAGNPREWFNLLEEQKQRARWRLQHDSNLTYESYLDLLQREHTSRNGVFGVKLHYYQFAELPAKLGQVPRLAELVGPAQLAAAFPHLRYVWLTRRDKARQAISYLIASSTGTWWDIAGAKTDPKVEAPEFDPQRLLRLERSLAAHDAKWKAYFSEHDIVPIVVHYEDLAAAIEANVRRVLRELGIAGGETVEIPPSRTRRQSTTRNDEWYERYVAYKATASNVPPPSHAEVKKVFVENAFSAIPEVWMRWVASQRAMRTMDSAIVDVLVDNGYPREIALAAMEPKPEPEPSVAKATAVLDVLGQLGQLTSPTIDRRTNISPSEFRDRYYAANRPVVIDGLLSRWPAMRWTPQHLKRVAGELEVEIMTGRDADPHYEVNAMWHRTPMRFAEYIDKVIAGGVTNDYNLVANNQFFQHPGTHALLADLLPQPPYLRDVPAGKQCFLWFGPAGTRTPLHHDTSNIFSAQIRGRKRYRLIPASQWRYVYNRVGVFSDVDVEAPDYERFPKFRNATIVDITVEPGQCLFIPVGWWHDVRSLDLSITVTFTNFIWPNHFNWDAPP